MGRNAVRTFFGFCLALAFSTVGASSASAQILDFYTGAYGGYAMGSVDIFQSSSVLTEVTDLDPLLFAFEEQGQFDMEGSFYGNYTGATLNLPNLGIAGLFVGAEGFYETADVGLTDSPIALGEGITFTEIERQNAVGINGILGVEVWNILKLFARAGYVNADYKYSALGPLDFTPGEISDEVNLDGYELGGGLEYAAWGWVSIRFDYGYRDFERADVFSSSSAFSSSAEVSDGGEIPVFSTITTTTTTTYDAGFEPSEHFIRIGAVIHLSDLF
jgi:opacity protein-like surface antigen